MTHKCTICEADITYPLTCKHCGAPMCDTHHASRKGNCGKCNNPSVLKSLRRSGLDCYETCPFQFKLKYIDGKLEDDGNVWSLVGNYLHDIFEEDSLLSEPQDLDTMYAKFEVKYAELVKSKPDLISHAQSLIKGEINTRMLERARTGISNYIDYRSTANPILHAEMGVSFKLSEDTPEITATIDRINILSDGELEIVDYKTGKVFVGKKLATDIQPPVYILGVQNLLGKLPKRFTFVFTDEKNVRTYERINDDQYQCTVRKTNYTFSLNETKQRILRIFADIQKERFGIPQKINQFYCENFCNAKRKGLCAGGLVQAWNNGSWN